ncbi:hypothetical protein GCM10020370_71070 [Paenibacillus hodogayensis]
MGSDPHEQGNLSGVPEYVRWRAFMKDLLEPIGKDGSIMDVVDNEVFFLRNVT